MSAKKKMILFSRPQMLALVLTLLATGTGLVAYRVATVALVAEDSSAEPLASPSQAPRKRYPKPILIGDHRPAKLPANQPSAPGLATPLPVNLPDGLPTLAPQPVNLAPAPVSGPTAPPKRAAAPASIPPVPKFMPAQQPSTTNNVFSQKGLAPTPAPSVAVKAVPLPPLVPLPQMPVMEVTPDPFGDEPTDDGDDTGE